MGYKRFYRASKPTPRNIALRYAGPCACCGATIKAGSIAIYYPAGTIAGVAESKIAHLGGMDGNSRVCSENIRLNLTDSVMNDFAGDGLDARYEDDCARMCGF